MPNEYETLMLKMDEGFNHVFGKVDEVRDKIDDLREEHHKHMPVCSDKFAGLDKRLSVREAVNGVKSNAEKEKKDWGKYFMRLTTGTIALGALTLLWKLLTGGAKIIVG